MYAYYENRVHVDKSANDGKIVYFIRDFKRN